VPRLLLLSVALLVPPLAIGWVSGCGPSVQSIYEGNVRFEHCYRLDLDVNIAPTHRLACWREWLRIYTYGQVRDRIEYARQRVGALEQGDTTRPSLNLTADRRPEERSWYLSEPAPTSAHAPPPPMWKAESPTASGPPPPASASAEPAPKPRPAPGEDCSRDCRADLEACNEDCATDAGTGKPKKCQSCEPDYKKCMRRCHE
jgi:hypothetical protein